MNRISCNIIRDLMILYDDNVCSEESRQMVEEHIAECGECRKIYQNARADLPNISLKRDEEEAGVDEADELREIARRACRKLERKITYRHILTVGIALFVIVIGFTFWTEWLKYQINVVPPEDVWVTELYELESGDIYCTFKCKGSFTYVNTSGILVPDGKRLQDYDEGWQEIYFQSSRPFDNAADCEVYKDEVSVVFPTEIKEGDTIERNEEGEWIYPDGYTRICTSIYYGRGSKEDRLLVWEQGQKIKPAPRDVEKRVREQGFIFNEENCYRGEMILE